MTIQHLQEQMRKVYQDLENPFDQPNAEMLRKMILQLAEVVGHVVEHLEKHAFAGEKIFDENIRLKKELQKQTDRIIKLERQNAILRFGKPKSKIKSKTH